MTNHRRITAVLVVFLGSLAPAAQAADLAMQRPAAENPEAGGEGTERARGVIGDFAAKQGEAPDAAQAKPETDRAHGPEGALILPGGIRLGGLFDRQSAEETQLDHARLLRIERRAADPLRARAARRTRRAHGLRRESARHEYLLGRQGHENGLHASAHESWYE